MSRFIVIEGIDGSGKTTLAKGLNKTLSEQGIETIFTREPGGSPFAEEIRQRLFSEAGKNMAPAEQMALVHEGRIDHLLTVILPALKARKVVISDRFEMSSLVYQVWHDKEELESVYAEYQAEIEKMLGDIIPEYVYLQVSPATVFERQKQSAEINHFDAIDLEPIKDRLKAYEYALTKVRGEIYSFDATPTPEVVLQNVFDQLFTAKIA